MYKPISKGQTRNVTSFGNRSMTELSRYTIDEMVHSTMSSTWEYAREVMAD